jgi:hypothetical protein
MTYSGICKETAGCHQEKALPKEREKQTGISKNAAEAALVAEPEWNNNAPRASLQQSRNADGHERGKGIRRMPNEQSMRSRVWESGPDPPFAPYYPDLEK